MTTDYVKWPFSCLLKWANDGFRVYTLKDLEIKHAFLCRNLSLYYIKQIDSMLPWFCSVIDHRRRQNVVRTSVTHSATPRVPRFCPYHIMTSSVIYYWTDARQHRIYLLNGCTREVGKHERSESKSMHKAYTTLPRNRIHVRVGISNRCFLASGQANEGRANFCFQIQTQNLLPKP